nr:MULTISPECIES: oligosaccharide flippase family protein [Bacillaceae]
MGGETLLYALMNVGTKLIAFLMLPIYTHYLTTTEMGVFENIEAMVSVLTFVVIFGTDNALAFYFFKTDDHKEQDKFVQTVLTFRFLLAVFFLLLFIIFGPLFSKFLLGISSYSKLFILAGVVLVSESVITLILTYYRYQFKAKKVAVITLIQLGLVASFTFVLLKYLNYKVESVYVSRLVSGALIILVLIIPIIKFFSFKVDFKILKRILAYGAPLVPASIAFWVITFANRFFLTHMESLESAGVYGVAIKFAAMISLLTSSIQMAWRPYSLSIQKNENAPQIYAQISSLILMLGMVGLVGVATIAPFLMKIMVSSNAYQGASKYIAFLSLGSFLSFYYLIISVGLFIKEQTKVLSKYVIYSAILSVILNIILIPLLSIWGAAIALVLSYLFVNVIIFKKSQEFYYIPLSIKKNGFIFLVGLVAMLTVTFIYELDLSKWFISIPWLALLGAVFFVVKLDKIRLVQKSR